MRHLIYKAEDWIAPTGASFILPHAFNRKLNPEFHSHDFYEVVFLFSGTVIHRIGDHVFSMQAGEVNILRPFDVHHFLQQTEQLDMFTLSITAEEADLFLAAYHIDRCLAAEQNPVRLLLQGQTMASFSSVLHRLNTCPTEHRHTQMRIVFGMLLHEYLRSFEPVSNSWMDRIIKQMNMPENLAEGVPALLRISGLSHAQLCRNMKKQCGTTPRDFVRELRLSYAFDLIHSTELPYEEIAELVGYSSFSHFSVSFKQRFGLTPAALRKTSPHARLL